MTNPYKSSQAAAPPWSPPPLKRRQIVLAVCIGLCITTALEIAETLSYGYLDLTSTFALLAPPGIANFAGASAAAWIGSIRVVLPLLLFLCLKILLGTYTLTQMSGSPLTADTLLELNLSSYITMLVGLVVGACIGHLLFKHRRRPRKGASPMGT